MENCILYHNRNGGAQENFLDVARASVSAGALLLIQIEDQSFKKLSAGYSNFTYSIKLGWLLSLTSLKGAKCFQLMPKGLSAGQ